jgi:hypothetical protein
MSPGAFDDVIKAHVERSFTDPVHAKLRVAVAHIEARGRKRTRKDLMDGSGRLNRGALLGWLSNWLFDYNTVETLTQFSAVIVCLIGVMYEANSVSGAPAFAGSVDSVTTVMLLVIIGTIVYLATTLTVEIYVLAGDAQAERVRAASVKKGKGKSLDGENMGRSGRLGTTDSGEVQVGNVEQQLNPMFMSANGSSAVSGGGDDAVFASRTPPPPELWIVFQQSYADKSKALAEAQSMLAQAKKRR